MTFRTIFYLFCLLGFTVSTASAEIISLRGDVEGDCPDISILSHDADRVQFEIRLPAVERLQGTLEGRRWDRIEIPGGGYELDLGAPEIPHFTRLLAIPARCGVRAEFEALETTTLSDIELMPAQGKDPVDLAGDTQPVAFDMITYSRDAFYPDEEVMVGEPALMRGVRLVGVRMHPVRYNPVTRELRIAHRYRVTVFFEGTDDRNVPGRPLRPMSRTWARLMKGTVINYDNLDLDITETGSYLIVCEDDTNLVENLLPPLIDWKKRKGHNVVVETFPQGASNTAIKGIIQNAYDTWDIPPEYVLLFGDTDGSYALPGWIVGWIPSNLIDHPYSQLDGGDILADVAIGRLPAGDSYEALVLINKVLFYEKDPYIANSDWYHEAVLIAGNAISGISTVQTNRWIKTRMVWNEYTEIDTFWYWMAGTVAGTLTPAINEGVSLVNYRGYNGMENFNTSSIAALTNGRKLPFVVTITCGTGGFAGYPESLMETFAVVGTPSTPKGAIACVGTATIYTHTRQNNTIDMGIFAGIFDEGITQAGNTLNRGKLELYNTYNTHDPGMVEDFCKYTALAGDPGVELFNGAIRYLDCSIPEMVQFGENVLNLTVTEPGSGPVEEALVCLYKEGELHEVGLTDADGQVTLLLNPSSTGNVKVTVTKQCFHPIIDSLDVELTDVTVGYYDHGIDDDGNGSSSGDGDGIINPGETVEIPLVLKNYGTSITATSITANATVSDEYAELDDAYETFPNLAPGITGSSADDFDLSLSSACPHGHVVRLDFIYDAAQGSWNGMLELEVVSYAMNIWAAFATGSDSLLSPGETANFRLTTRNEGGKTADSLIASLLSLSPYVIVNDSLASFGTVAVGSISTCGNDPFNLTAAEDAPPGICADLAVTFRSSTGATQTDTITIALGTKCQTDPQGPDEYGYFCFDNTDLMYSQAPTYYWIEINPASGGSGTQLPIEDTHEEADTSVNVSLPFTFRYYGENTDAITVCSNGWISTWANNSFTDFRNYPIPSPIGPNGMIAPFWDDLITWEEGHIFTHFDSVNHWFIIEWYRMKTLGWPNWDETFEIILFDPAHYPTPTGDGPILFQYQTIAENYGISDDNPYSTVGIERPDQQDGIEIVYWNTYNDPATAPLANGRAYLFTTDFYYALPGNPELFIEVTYVTGSPVPPGGGNLYYELFVENRGSVARSFDTWIDVAYEECPPTTISQRSFVCFQPGASLYRPDMYFPVPASYAAGDYSLTGRLGDYPDIVWEESSIPWVKEGDRYDGDFIPWVPEDAPNPFEDMIPADVRPLPDTYALHPAFPNPFNPAATIRYELCDASFVNLAVYDLSGRRIAEMVNGWRDAGYHEANFDGSGLASGVYVYRIEAQGFMASAKMVLMK